MEKRIIKNCGTCKYFNVHYLKYERDEKVRYQRTSYGHCGGRKQARQIVRDKKACEKWEQS